MPHTPRLLELGNLNDDVLLLVIKHLSSYTLTLSTVSKRFRSLCLPKLFRKCAISCGMGIRYPPLTVLPYIQTLLLYGLEDFEYRYDDLKSVVPHMVSLHTVRFSASLAGIPQGALLPLLSSPSLRTLEIIDSPWLRVECPHPPKFAAVSSPLSQFVYMVNTWREDDLKSADTSLERQFTEPILARTRNTIEHLQLPAEAVPLQQMAMAPYERIRYLALYGYYDQTQNPTLLLRALAGMPRLNTLDLKLVQRKGPGRTLIWPPGASSNATFDFLENLSVSYPDPTDEIFSRLPPSVRHLSLFDWPRHYLCADHASTFYKHTFSNPSQYLQHSILASTELRYIVKRCDLPFVESLNVAFQASRGEPVGALFQDVASRFSTLNSLQIHRYRAEGEAEVDVTSIAHGLSPLRALRTLRIHLDVEVPDPYRMVKWRPQRDAIEHYARALAQAMGPNHSLETLGILARFWFRNQWASWRIARDEAGGTELVPVSEWEDKDEFSDTPIALHDRLYSAQRSSGD